MHAISCDLILPKSENSSLLRQFSFGFSGFKFWICYLSCMCGLSSVPIWSLPWLDTKQNPTKVLSNSRSIFHVHAPHYRSLPLPLSHFSLNTGCSLYQCIDLTIMLDPITYLSIQKKTGDKEKKWAVSLQYRFLLAREKNEQLEWDIGHDKSNQNQDSSFQSVAAFNYDEILLPFQRATAKLYVDLEIENLDKIQVLKQSYFTFQICTQNNQWWFQWIIKSGPRQIRSIYNIPSYSNTQMGVSHIIGGLRTTLFLTTKAYTKNGNGLCSPEPENTGCGLWFWFHLSIGLHSYGSTGDSR